jgi:hypothetical protein
MVWTLAHHPHVTYEGPAAWEALVVLGTGGLVVVAVLAASGRLELSSASALVSPVAVVAVVAAIGTIPLRETVGGVMHWAAPIGIALLLGLIGTAVGRIDLLSLPVLGGVGALMLAGLLVVSPALERRPAAVATPHVAEDASLAFAELRDGDELLPGGHTITVEVHDGSIGPPDVDPEDLPDDIDELGHVLLTYTSPTEGRRLAAASDDDQCTIEEPCDRVGFEIELTPGEWELEAQFLAADGLRFEPRVTTTATIEVG